VTRLTDIPLAERLADPAAASRERSLAAQQPPEPAPPGILELIGLGLTTSTSIDGLPFAASRFSVGRPDPDFLVTQEMLRQASDAGLSDESLLSLAEAPNRAVFDLTLQRELRLMRSRARLDERPIAGFVASLGGQILDPGFIAAEAVAAGIAGPIGAAGGLSARIGRLTRSGAVLASSTAGLEAVLTTTDAERDPRGIAIAAASVLAIQAARIPFAARAARRADQAASIQAVSAAVDGSLRGRKRIDAAIASLSDSGRARLREGIDSLTPENLRRSLADLLGLEPEEAARLIDDTEFDPADIIDDLTDQAASDFERAVASSGSEIAEVRSAATEIPPAVASREDLAALEAGKSGEDFFAPEVSDVKLGPIDRLNVFSSSAALLKSPVEGVRKLAPLIGVGLPVRTRDGRWIRPRTGFDWAVNRKVVIQRRYAGVYEPARNEFVKRVVGTADGIRNAEDAVNAFHREVARAVISTDASDLAPEAVRVARLQRGVYRDLLAQAKRHGLLLDVDPNDLYMPLQFDPNRMASAIAEHGREAVVDVLTRSLMLSGFKDPETAGKIASGVLELVSRRPRFDFELGRAIGQGDFDTMRRIMSETLAEAPSESIQEAADAIESALRRDESGAFFERRRLFRNIDVSAPSVRLRDRSVSFLDLINDDAHDAFLGYLNAFHGRLASKTTLDAIAADLGEEIGSVDQLIRVLTRQFDEDQLGLIPAERRRFQADVDRIRKFFTLMEGKPLFPDSAGAAVARSLTAFNTLRLDGAFFFPQLAETGAGIADAGVTASVQTIPALPRLIRMVVTGAAPDGLQRDIQSAFGALNALGVERLSDRFTAFDEAQGLTRIRRGERRLRRLARQSLTVTGFMPLLAVQREALARATVLRLVNIARSGRTMSAKRLADLGLTADEWAEIARELARDDITEAATGVLGVKIRRVHFSRMSARAEAGLIGALARSSANAILSPSIESSRLWMSAPLARVFLQFRTFTIGAYQTLLLRNLRLHDAKAASVGIFSLATAALAEALRASLRSAGRPDAEEFREKNLTPSAVARAAVRRSGFVSFLPDVIDAALQQSGEDPLFNFRVSGLPSGAFTDVVLNSPTEGLVGDVGTSVFRTARNALRGGPVFDKRNVRALLNLAPFRRMIGVEQAMERLIDLAPDPE